MSKNKKVRLDKKSNVDPSEFTCGVIVARFQVDDLHEGHKGLIDLVSSYHKKVLIFLGVSNTPNMPDDPLDFATRRVMVQDYAPDAVILPLRDNRSNEMWSVTLDNQINMVFGDVKALLYGSRDSFIPKYTGNCTTTILVSDINGSGTEKRQEITREILKSSDFRSGVIHSCNSQRPVTYPTVDVVMHDNNGKILLAKKPGEEYLRFIGGFVDRSDTSYEHSARREFMEETGGNAEINTLTYVTSQKIEDWRYKKTPSGIMTTLFIGGHSWGPVKASDDIETLEWVDIKSLGNINLINRRIMPEHRSLMLTLINKLNDGTLKINNLTERLNM